MWEETIPGGNHWSGLIRRDTALRFTDLQGGANLSALFYNPEDKLERYNKPDTLKAQHTAFLTPATSAIRIWGVSCARR